MSMLERDYVLRMIRQLAQTIGRILGLLRAGRAEEALDAVRTTADGIFGPLRVTLDAVDVQTVARLLDDREKLEAYAALTAVEAAIREAMGDLPAARRGERRALSLYLEAVILDRQIGDDTRQAIAELRQKVGDDTLPARYLEALGSP